MSAEHASLTRSPFSPRSTASAAWAWSTRSAANRNEPSSERSRPRTSLGWTLGRRTYCAGLEAIRPFDVGEPVEAADGGKPPVDGGRRKAATLHGADVQLDLGAGRRQDDESLVSSPLKERSQVVRYASRVRPW